MTSHEDASDQGPGLALGPFLPVGDDPGERSGRASKAPTVNATWPGSHQSDKGGHRLRWYRFGHRPLREMDARSGQSGVAAMRLRPQTQR